MSDSSIHSAQEAAKVLTEFTVSKGQSMMHEESDNPEVNDNLHTDQKAQITFMDAAARKVRALIEEEGNAELKLRVYITGGGCSGFQYGFTFDVSIGPDDKVVIKQIDEDDVYLLVDPLSYQYLHGAEIDYSEGITGAQFIIRNPNAQTTCGCGSSFSV